MAQEFLKIYDATVVHQESRRAEKDFFFYEALHQLIKSMKYTAIAYSRKGDCVDTRENPCGIDIFRLENITSLIGDVFCHLKNSAKSISFSLTEEANKSLMLKFERINSDISCMKKSMEDLLNGMDAK